MNQDIQDMLRKGAIVVLDPKEDQFLSILFLVKKNRPVVNLKDLNKIILYQHFKMEEWLPGDNMSKIELKDA